MQADTVSIQSLFQDRRQYRVPFFQRPYVWNKEDQWERLWADVSDKAETRADGDETIPHFLGATVLEPQKRDGLIGVETLNIIDGQQRLTTLQYLLAALAIVLRTHGDTRYLTVVSGCLQNGNVDTMQNPEFEVFKVWPTFRDRSDFQMVMNATSQNDLRTRFPTSFTQAGALKKIGIDHPPALEAVWYFADQITQWSEREGAAARSSRLEALTNAILIDLRIVCISLGEKDDAQVIFETLNGHGAQLHATDLIRNFVFMRADRESVPAGQLFENLWRPFEASFWTESQRRGRLTKPRMEWFVQSTLQAVLQDDVEIGRLYAAYRRFANASPLPIPAAEQLQALSLYGDSYKQLVTGVGSDPIARFGRRTAAWDASTTHALALRIARSDLSGSEQMRMFDFVTSYLIRRAVCGLTPKSYNKIFLQQLKRLSAGEMSAETLKAGLSALEGDASRWPGDDEFRKAWLSEPMYQGNLDAPRVKSILAEIEQAMRPPHTEEPVPVGLDILDIDHILPTSWFEYWPLRDGTSVTEEEAKSAIFAEYLDTSPNQRISDIAYREKAKKTIGNLTLLHYGVNRSLQNREFTQKRDKVIANTNLHLNRDVMLLPEWDEAKINQRGQTLFDVAVALWPPGVSRN